MLPASRFARPRGSGSWPRTAPPVLGATNICHGDGACAAGGAAPSAATRVSRLERCDVAPSSQPSDRSALPVSRFAWSAVPEQRSQRRWRAPENLLRRQASTPALNKTSIDGSGTAVSTKACCVPSRITDHPHKSCHSNQRRWAHTNYRPPSAFHVRIALVLGALSPGECRRIISEATRIDERATVKSDPVGFVSFDWNVW